MITSPANKKIKEIQALNKKPSYRRETGLFTVEGVRMFREIPEDRMEQVFVSEGFLKDAEPEVREKILRSRYEVVQDSVFPALSDTRTPQGILAAVRQERHSLSGLIRKDACILILETIQDPGNLGTMLRAGEGAGLTGIVCDSGTADLYNPKVVRSTMGSIFRVPVVVAEDLHGAVRALKSEGVRIYAAHLRGQRAYDEESYAGPSAFMIGNEAAGLKEETAALADALVKIPMLGKVESLNAAVAASVLLYELARQRRDPAAGKR